MVADIGTVLTSDGEDALAVLRNKLWSSFDSSSVGGSLKRLCRARFNRVACLSAPAAKISSSRLEANFNRGTCIGPSEFFATIMNLARAAKFQGPLSFSFALSSIWLIVTSSSTVGSSDPVTVFELSTTIVTSIDDFPTNVTIPFILKLTGSSSRM